MLDWKTVEVKENSLVSFEDDLHDDSVTMNPLKRCMLSWINMIVS